MTGSELKEKIKNNGIKFKDVAARLDMSYNNLLTNIFNSEDVRSSVIERVAGILGVSVSYMYGEYNCDKMKLEIYETETEALRRMNGIKDEMIAKLESRLNELEKQRNADRR